MKLCGKKEITLTQKDIELLMDENEEHPKYDLIENNITAAGYKNSSTHDIIIRKKGNNKYFKGSSTYFHAAFKWDHHDQTFVRVIPKEIVTIKYEEV